MLDFDSFFASVEQQDQPRLRGQPVGIVPSLGVETTCCIAASYEAKRHGVKTGTLVRDARFKCPQITFVEGNHRRYVEVHQAAREAIEHCIPVEQRLSIDEFLCVIPPNWREPAFLAQKCAAIKAELAQRVGPFITCSIGIGPNQFLAKMASKMRKPNGVQRIALEHLPEILHELELEDLTGIGRSMGQRLRRHGIHTVAQLCAADSATLRRIWGSVHGRLMAQQLRGIQPARLPEPPQRTISHSHILPPCLRTPELAYAVLHKQLQKAARRLRALGYFTAQIGLSVKFDFAWRWNRERRIFPTQDTLTLIEHLHALWQNGPGEGTPVQVRVVLSELIPASAHTPSLFAADNQPRRVALDRAMDAINLRYGNAALYYAEAHAAYQQAAAPMRVAFNHIPHVELEA